MEKLDLKKMYRRLYLPTAKQAALVDVPAFQFAMIDGRIEVGEAPENAPAFHAALAALYGLSYTLKFMSKQRPVDPLDYTVMPLEGLWWVDSGRFDFERKEAWNFTLMVMQPDHISKDMFLQALDVLSRKIPGPALERLRLERFHEGPSIQIMHLGPYAGEPASLAKMQAFADEHGWVYRGDHHEIYLGDPRRAVPEKLRTVLRHPVEAAGLPVPLLTGLRPSP